MVRSPAAAGGVLSGGGNAETEPNEGHHTKASEWRAKLPAAEAEDAD